MKGKTLFKRIVLILIIPYIIISLSAYVIYALIYHQNLDVSPFYIPVLLISLFVISIIFHEFGHFISFKLLGYKIKAVMFLGIVLRFKKPYIVFDSWVLKMGGGIVIPKLKTIDDDITFLKVKRAFRIALLMGPIFTYLSLIMMILVYIITKQPLFFILSFLLIPIISIFHKSFFVEMNYMYGDYKAYTKLKKEDDIILALYYQHSMLYEIDEKTLYFIYHKALKLLESKESLNIKKDFQFITILLEGIRLGYINKDIKHVMNKIPKRHALYKALHNSIWLSTYVYVLTLMGDYDTVSYYLEYLMKRNKTYKITLALLDHFLNDLIIDNTLMNEIIENISIYQHITDIKVLKKHFETKEPIKLTCEI